VNFKFKLKLRNGFKVYEVFTFGAYSVANCRWRPSVYRYPFWSMRWLFWGVTFSGPIRVWLAGS
jgi:hypothetical protein